MKKVVSVSLGPSSKDSEFTTRFLGHDFRVSRVGADGDSGKAWEMLRRHQADADAIGLGMIQDHFDIGSRRHVYKETERLPPGHRCGACCRSAPCAMCRSNWATISTTTSSCS